MLQGDPDSVALLQEGTLKFCADLVSFLLLLLEVIFELVCGETHFGAAAFVWGPVGTEPGALQTLGRSGSPPALVSQYTHLRSLFAFSPTNDLWFTKKNDNRAVCLDENHSPGFVIQAALHEVQSALWQTGVTAPKLDLPLLDVSVLLPAELWNERAVGTQPRKGKHKYTNYNSRKKRWTTVVQFKTASMVYHDAWNLLHLHYKWQNSDRPNVSFRPDTLSFQDFWSFRKDNINWKKQTRMFLMSCAVRPHAHALFSE